MNDSSDTNRGSTQREDPILETAIEKCIELLENGNAGSIDSVIAEFPQHENQLREFLNDWGGMEGWVAQISDSLHGDESDSQTALPVEIKTLGDYELLEQIGAGGMGVIFKARQISLNRIVALKMISGPQSDQERFRLEAEAIAAMAHPNIVSIYEIGEHEGRLFFAMQYVDGCNLKQYLNKHKVTATDAARIVETVSRAVHYAHQRGILHRDLKPANILMDADGQPHITDFGLAKRIDQDVELTHSGTIMGTPGYMAPEQALGKTKNLTVATDVYGLGAILYALLTGEAPFTGDSTLEVIRQVGEQPPRSPRAIVPELSHDIDTLCLKCLEKAPEHRYVSAESLAKDLARFQSGLPVQARPVPGLEKAWRWCRRNPALAGLSVAAVLLLFATTISSFMLAISERNARINSDRNAEKEKTLKNEVDAALVEERKTKSALHLSNGIWRAETGNVPGALLWFAESARSTVADREQIQSHLRRWNSWFNCHPRLVAATLLAQSFGEVEKGGWDDINFRPAGKKLLVQAGSRFVIWDFEQDELWDLADVCDSVRSAAWSAHGDEIAMGCEDGRVMRLDPDTKATIQEIQTGGPVSQVAFSHDCQMLAVAHSTEMQILDIESGDSILQLQSHGGQIVYLAFSPVHQDLVTVASDRKARLFSLAGNGEPTLETNIYRTRPTEYYRPFWPTFVDNGRALLLRSNPRDFQIYDVGSGQLQKSTTLDHLTYSFSVSNDLLLLSSENDAQVRRIHFGGDEVDNVATIAEDQNQADESALSDPLTQMLHAYRTTNCDISRTGLTATGNWDQNVRIWSPDFDTETTAVQKQHLAILPHQTRVRQVKFSSDSRYLVTVQIDGLIRVFETLQRDDTGYRLPTPGGRNFLRVLDHDRFISTGSSSWYSANTNVEMHSVQSQKSMATTPELTRKNDGTLIDAICSNNNRSLITLHSRPERSRTGFVSDDGSAGRLCFWSWPDCSKLEAEIQLDTEPRWVEHHPFENQIAVCTANMDVILINTENFEIEKQLLRDGQKYDFGRYSHFPQHAANQQLLYSPDGTSILVWSQYNVGCFVWDIEKEKLRFEPFSNGGWPISGADYSPDGNYIVLAGGRNKYVTVIDAITGEQIGEKLPHTVVTYKAHFSPDSKQVVTACRDGKARVFDLQTGELIFNELNHEADVLDAVFSPDSKFILTIGQDRQFKVWNTSDGTIAMRPTEISLGSRHIRVTPDSRFALVYGGHYFNSVISLEDTSPHEAMRLEDTIIASQLISNQRLENHTPIKISTDQWYQIWQRFNGGR